ncbi:MAG: S8 family serine peptidase, partial [Pyrinomonadaceae bacterium]
NGMENSYLLNAAAEWLDRVAGASPLVVSCSFGGHGSGHDGQMVAERQLNERFPLNGAGRAIVIAAGNEGRAPIHAEATFGDRKSAKLIGWDALEPGAVLNIYFDSAEEGIAIAPAANTQLGTPRWDLNPFTGQASVTLKLARGPGGLWLFNESGKQTKAHLFLPDGAPAAAFWPEMATYSTLVGEPGTAANAITVGSYDWNDNFHRDGSLITLLEVCPGSDGARSPLEIGKISCYSSPGPTRTGKVKPEIVAPGEWYSASYAKVPGRGGVEGWRDIDTTGNYAGMNGTSSATPYTAGVIALMFQKKPTLTLGEVRSLLTTKASRDPFTGALPNKHWGHGKLDMAAVGRIFAALN